MAAGEGPGALEASVLGEARRRAEEIAATAEAQAGAAERRAREAAEARREAAVAEARAEAARERSRVESAAHLEARRRVLAKRDELIARALARARQHLLVDLSPGERRAALARAVVEAAVALGGEQLLVRANPQDAAFLTPEHLQELERRLAAEGVTAGLAPGPPVEVSGGAIVSREEGRVILDNSFEAVLKRLQFTLRNEVWQALAGGVEVPESAPAATESGR